MPPPSPEHVHMSFDLGGTRVRAALVSADNSVRAHRAAPTPAGGEPQPLAALLQRLTAELRSHAESLAWLLPQDDAVGVCLPGILDPARRLMRHAVNLPRLQHVDVAALCSAAIGRRVVLETDVNAAALAQWQALPDPVPRFLYLSLGTGVGGAVILNGQILRHTNGGAGHFGFLVADTGPHATARLTGLPGCLSEYLSGRVLRDAEANTRRRAAEALAVALSQLTHLYAPDVIALGGGGVEHEPWLLPAALEAFQRLPSPIIVAPRVLAGALSSDAAGVVGAALAARSG